MDPVYSSTGNSPTCQLNPQASALLTEQFNCPNVDLRGVSALLSLNPDPIPNYFTQRIKMNCPAEPLLINESIAFEINCYQGGAIGQITLPRTSAYSS
jgi:hypothetical protein